MNNSFTMCKHLTWLSQAGYLSGNLILQRIERSVSYMGDTVNLAKYIIFFVLYFRDIYLIYSYGI